MGRACAPADYKNIEGKLFVVSRYWPPARPDNRSRGLSLAQFGSLHFHYMAWSLSFAEAFLCRKEPREREKKQPAGDDGKGEKGSFRLRVVSLMSCVVPLRIETSAAHVYASFSPPRYKKVRYARVYLVLQPQHVRETTSEVSEPVVGKTTVNRFRLLLFLLGCPAGVFWEERVLWYNYYDLSLV